VVSSKAKAADGMAARRRDVLFMSMVLEKLFSGRRNRFGDQTVGHGRKAGNRRLLKVGADCARLAESTTFLGTARQGGTWRAFNVPTKTLNVN